MAQPAETFAVEMDPFYVEDLRRWRGRKTTSAGSCKWSLRLSAERCWKLAASLVLLAFFSLGLGLILNSINLRLLELEKLVAKGLACREE